MKRQQHRGYQDQGRKRALPARTALDTSGTTASGRAIDPAATDIHGLRNPNLQESKAPPPSVDEPSNRPITFAHLSAGWKIVVVFCTVLVFIVGVALRYSDVVSRTEQNTESIKEIRTKTEKLVSDTAVISTKVDAIGGRTARIEDQLQRGRR